MLNEWSDRVPDPRPPRWWVYVTLAFIAGMTVWGTVQMIWSVIAR